MWAHGVESRCGACNWEGKWVLDTCVVYDGVWFNAVFMPGKGTPKHTHTHNVTLLSVIAPCGYLMMRPRVVK